MIRSTLLALSLACPATAQDSATADACAGEVYLETQAAVDAFNCEVFDGALWIRGRAVSNLHGLSELRKAGSVYVFGTAVRDLAGLGSLEEVGSTFSVYGNPYIETLDGLRRLTKVGAILQARANRRLYDIDAFRVVRSVGDYAVVRENPTLSDCSCGIYEPATEGDVDFVWVVHPEIPLLVGENAPGCNSFEEAMANYNAAVCAARRGE